MGKVLQDYQSGLAYIRVKENVVDERGRVQQRRAHEMLDARKVDPKNALHRYFDPKFIARHLDFVVDLKLAAGASMNAARAVVRAACVERYVDRVDADLGEPHVNTLLFDRINGISQILELMNEVEQRQPELAKVDAGGTRLFSTRKEYVFASSRGLKSRGSFDIKQVYRETFEFGAAAWGGGAPPRYVIHHFHGR